MLREAVFPLWETPRDGGISDINYREIVVEVEANKKYQKHVDSFRKEWKKASRADIILGLLSLLDKISRKAGPTQPLLVERAELWKSVINLACAENLRIVLYVTQKSAITSPRGYGGELSWHRSAQNAMDSASLAWLNTDSIGSEVVRQIIQRARAQLQVSIDEARSDPRFKEVDETAYGSGLPFDTAYYTPADLIAIRDKLTLENIKTCLTSIVGHERISNWIPD